MDQELSYVVERNISYYSHVGACMNCGNTGHIPEQCPRKVSRNTTGQDSGTIIVQGREVRVIDDLGGTHSFFVERTPNEFSTYQDNLCRVIKSVYPHRKNVWLLGKHFLPYRGVYICI